MLKWSFGQSTTKIHILQMQATRVTNRNTGWEWTGQTLRVDISA